MRITVTLQVDVDLDAWTEEYGTTGAAESLMQALSDLREPGEYPEGQKWRPGYLLTSAHSVTAIVDLDRQPV